METTFYKNIFQNKPISKKTLFYIFANHNEFYIRRQL